MSLIQISEMVETLTATDAIADVSIVMDGSEGIPTFALASGWNIGLKDKDPLEAVDASLHYKGVEYGLTKEAVLSMGHAVGIPPAYATKTPSVLIQSHLNYWATHSADLALKLIVNGSSTVLAVAKEGIVPFPNTKLLAAVTGVSPLTSAEVCDLSSHSLHATTIRLVASFASQASVTTSRNGETVTDYWIPGIQIQNSLTGKTPLSIKGLLYNLSTESVVVLPHTERRYNRKTMGQNLSEVLEWVSQSTSDILDGFSFEFEMLHTLLSESAADALDKVLTDIFKTYKVPLKARSTVMDNLIKGEDYTYYGIALAISESAKEPHLPPHFATNLMEIAGAIAGDMDHRCNSCKQVVD